MPPSKHAPRLIESAERRAAILRRRAEGLTFKKLAEEFGISQRWVRQIVAHEFARLTDERNEAAVDALGIALGRLDDLLWAVWDEAMEGDHESIKLAAGIIEKQVRVLGVKARPDDAPQVTVNNVYVGLEERAARLGLNLEQLRGPAPVIDVKCVEVK